VSSTTPTTLPVVTTAIFEEPTTIDAVSDVDDEVTQVTTFPSVEEVSSETITTSTQAAENDPTHFNEVSKFLKTFFDPDGRTK
jgi:hypothetical protein